MSSSAHRRIKNTSTKLFKKYIQNLIDQAKLKGYSVEKFQNFSDLQILIQLQHFGAATCLLDFTKNFLKALWFACQNTTSSNNIDGTIFVLDAKKLNKITSENLSDPIDKFICNETLWLWIPENINNRILAQDSACVFGTPILQQESLFEKIIISASDKEVILYELDTIFNINSDSLFPDFYGFALNQNQTQSLQFPTNHKTLLEHTIKEERWEEAKSLLIGFPDLLTPKILYLFLKKGLNLEKILESYKKHTTENTLQSFEFNMFVDALAGYGFSEEKYKKHVYSECYPTEDFGDPTNEIEIFFIILFGLFELELNKREEMPTGTKGDIEAMRIDWVLDKNFSTVKEIITVLCNHQAVPKELIEPLKNVIENIKRC